MLSEGRPGIDCTYLLRDGKGQRAEGTKSERDDEV